MILVTGAGGTVGGQLVQELTERDVPFRAGYHSPEKLSVAEDAGIDAVEIDFTRSASIREALEDVDTLFLLCATSPHLAQYEQSVISAAKQCGVEYVVKLSVWGADSDGFTFARWHRPAELALQSSGLDWCVLRPNGFMQNAGHLFGVTIRDHGAFYVPEVPGISHIDVRDLARVAATVLTDRDTHAGKVYELSGPEAVTYAQVADQIGDALGKPVRHVAVTPAAYRDGAITAGMPEWLAKALVDLSAFQSRGKACGVTGHVHDITGRAPGSFADYARDFRETFLP